MNIVILDDYQDAVRKLQCASKLEPYTVKVFTNTVKGVGQLAVRLRDADILVLIRDRTPISRQLVEKLPRLKLIAQTGRIGNHIDLAACTEHGVAVAEGLGSPIAPAELSWALILTAMRRIPQYVANLKHGAWQQSGLRSASMPSNFGLGQVLAGKTLGIWSYGRIGRIVAGYGRAFGMRVLVWGSEPTRQHARADGYETADSKAQFFATCDVLSLHLRLGEQTQGCISLEDLSLMKPTALLVNTARGPIVDESALIKALQKNRIAGAALDVFEQEPLPAHHPFRTLDTVLATPHVGYVSQQNYHLFFSQMIEDIQAWAAGAPIRLLS